MTNKVERRESNPANPANPAAGERSVLGLRFPEVQRARLYRDPLLVVIDEEERVAAVAARKAAEAAAVPVRPCRDRYYRLAARQVAIALAAVEIRRMMKGHR